LSLKCRPCPLPLTPCPLPPVPCPLSLPLPLALTLRAALAGIPPCNKPAIFNILRASSQTVWFQQTAHERPTLQTQRSAEIGAQSSRRAGRSVAGFRDAVAPESSSSLESFKYAATSCPVVRELLECTHTHTHTHVHTHTHTHTTLAAHLYILPRGCRDRSRPRPCPVDTVQCRERVVRHTSLALLRMSLPRHQTEHSLWSCKRRLSSCKLLCLN
jgi:hypothetical protein